MALENLILPNLIQYPWQTSPGATVTVGCEFVFLATSLDWVSASFPQGSWPRQPTCGARTDSHISFKSLSWSLITVSKSRTRVLSFSTEPHKIRVSGSTPVSPCLKCFDNSSIQSYPLWTSNNNFQTPNLLKVPSHPLPSYWWEKQWMGGERRWALRTHK